MATSTCSQFANAILEQIPKSHHEYAFGTYSMSKPCHDDPALLLRLWFTVKNRDSLLSSCAALLCLDPAGTIMILSGPRLCQSESEGTVIVAQKGNAVERTNIVSIPSEKLLQTVIGKWGQNSLRHMIDIPIRTFLDGDKLMAELPILLPLAFGHSIDEDIDQRLLRFKLASIHPVYSNWYDSTIGLDRDREGKSLELLPYVAPLFHKEGSLLWKKLSPELDCIRKENLEKYMAALQYDKNDHCELDPQDVVGSEYHENGSNGGANAGELPEEARFLVNAKDSCQLNGVGGVAELDNASDVHVNQPNPQPVARKRSAPLSSDAVAKKQKASRGGVEGKILAALSQFHRGMHMESVPLILVASCSGYTNFNSAAFKHAWTQLKNQGIVVETGTKTRAVRATELGMRSLPLVDLPSTNADVHERLLGVIGKLPKATNNLKRVWEPLSDGAEHEIKYVAEQAGYKNVNSPIFKEPINLLVDLEFVVRDKSKKTLKLCESMFPFGNNDDLFLEEVVAI